jgi:hypothetical protein
VASGWTFLLISPWQLLWTLARTDKVTFLDLLLPGIFPRLHKLPRNHRGQDKRRIDFGL